MEKTEDIAQLQLLFTDPIQHDYEAIRPVVLFGQAIADRSQETNLERTTIGDKARRIITEGILGIETFHEFEDAYEARWTVVRLYYEGWNKKSIADMLKLSPPGNLVDW
jgi:hypothetical protein